MKSKHIAILAAMLPLALHALPNAWGQAAAPAVAAPSIAPALPLFNFSAPDIEDQFAEDINSNGQTSFTKSADPAAPGLDVTLQPGSAEFPGILCHPKGPSGKPVDISAYGHVEARITNTGSKPLNIAMRLDNSQDAGGPGGSNTETAGIKPGETGKVTVIPGYAYGRKPSFKLRKSAIANILFFATKSPEVQSFRIESIVASGPADEVPPVDPASLRIKPKDGFVLGKEITVDAAKQIEAKNQAEATLDGAALKISFVAGKGDQAVVFKPAIGRWDFREALQVRAKVKNIGQVPATLQMQVLSNAGPTDVATSASPLDPGAEGEVVATFVPSSPWLGIKDSVKTSWNGQPGTGTKFISDAVRGIKFFPTAQDGAQSLLVESIEVGLPAPTVLPDWVGKRPPVEGDWVKTFDEEFNGNSIDLTKWNIYAPNYWDKRSHFSKDNVIVKDGVVALRYEKKTGYHNDDPKQKQTDYATGFLDTYGKWVQRYGYFEARMKTTKGPGMWPAFWLMPDRGVEAGPQWKRADTGSGGMEFDIWEYLGRWGQYRYNIAMHWDGYGKNHQQTGTTTNYVMPDKDGFITMGLLWKPGLAVYYANGKEVLRWETPRISNIPSDIMFTNVTGGWDNNGIDDTQMPDEFLIDYVRAWQLKELASPEDGVKSTSPQSAAQ